MHVSVMLLVKRSAQAIKSVSNLVPGIHAVLVSCEAPNFILCQKPKSDNLVPFVCERGLLFFF